MHSKRYTMGTFLRGLAAYLDDLGKLVQGKTHVMYQSNAELDKR